MGEGKEKKYMVTNREEGNRKRLLHTEKKLRVDGGRAGKMGDGH